MPENVELFDQVRMAARRLADEDRKQQDEQQRWAMLADDYHNEIRRAADFVGRKAISIDLGVDLSTVSNWLSCENGRGFPPPRLLLYLRDKVQAFAAWEAESAGYLPPERPRTLSAEERLRRIENALAANPDIQRAVHERAFGPAGRRG